MSFTPAITIAAWGATLTTSRANRARIWSARSPLTPRFRTHQLGCSHISQYAYWLVSSPLPSGGASRGDLNPGVPAVVESPRPTTVTASRMCQLVAWFRADRRTGAIGDLTGRICRDRLG